MSAKRALEGNLDDGTQIYEKAPPVQNALDISEILCLIFEELANDKPALACSAQCCKAWSSLALDVLWRDLDDPEILSELWRVITYFDNPDSHVPDYICSARFMEYTRRIQKIPRYSVPEIEPWCWCLQFLGQLASRQPPSACFFPIMRDLFVVERSDLPIIPSFIGPSLRRLTVDTSWASEQTATAPEKTHLHIATSQAPLLQYVRLSGRLATAMATQTLAPVLEFRYLRILDLTSIECVGESSMITKIYQDLISGLSTLGELTELHLPWQITINHIPERVEFQNLKVLHTTRDPFAVTRFINTVSSPNLHTVILDLYGRLVTGLSMQSFIDALCYHHGMSLRVLHVTSGRSLSPAFASELRHLEEVKFHIWTQMSVADAHMMASAWPNLRSLDLNGPLGSIMCNIDRFVPFARFCPQLAFLQVGINDSTYPDVLSFPQLRHGLRSLSLTVHYSSTDLAHLAALVDRLFPKLVTVIVDKSMGAVFQCLQEFQSARGQCFLRSVNYK